MSGSWSLSIPPENRGSGKGLVVEKDDLLLSSKAASYLNENSMLKPLLSKHKKITTATHYSNTVFPGIISTMFSTKRYAK